MKRWSSTRSTIILKPLHSKRWATYHHPPLITGFRSGTRHSDKMHGITRTRATVQANVYLWQFLRKVLSRSMFSHSCLPMRTFVLSPWRNSIVYQIKGLAVCPANSPSYERLTVSFRHDGGGVKMNVRAGLLFSLFCRVLPVHCVLPVPPNRYVRHKQSGDRCTRGPCPSSINDPQLPSRCLVLPILPIRTDIGPLGLGVIAFSRDTTIHHVYVVDTIKINWQR